MSYCSWRLGEAKFLAPLSIQKVRTDDESVIAKSPISLNLPLYIKCIRPCQQNYNDCSRSVSTSVRILHTMSACLRSFFASNSITAFASAFRFFASACLTPSVDIQYGPITMLDGSEFSRVSLSCRCRSISCFTSAADLSWESYSLIQLLWKKCKWIHESHIFKLGIRLHTSKVCVQCFVQTITSVTITDRDLHILLYKYHSTCSCENLDKQPFLMRVLGFASNIE